MSEKKGKLSLHTVGQLLRNGIVARNPVLVSAMGMCPVVAAGITLKNGVILSLILGALLIPTSVLSSCLYSRLPRWARPPALVLVAALLYCGVAWWRGRMPYNMPAALGIYAPILIINSVITSRAEKYAMHHAILPALVDGISCAIGFALVVCICSAFRELFAYGTLWGQPVMTDYKTVRAIALPCFGFLILGYLAAAVKGVRILRARRRMKRQRSGQQESAKESRL